MKPRAVHIFLEVLLVHFVLDGLWFLFWFAPHRQNYCSSASTTYTKNSSVGFLVVFEFACPSSGVLRSLRLVLEVQRGGGVDVRLRVSSSIVLRD